ncbi:MAG: 50S ribosomal protein L24 [Chloroflexi bacterium RBG_16_48_8]|nr:MAG: 50S ribosomal protein L24 [Chloroflexi bacterium RBG_16_48_8]
MGQIRIIRGDTVEVINGRDKGLRGEVLRMLPKDESIIVQSIAMRKKHQKQIQTGGRTMSPGIIQFESPIHISNVMLVCPKCDTATRVAFVRKEGERKRVCKKCQAEI